MTEAFLELVQQNVPQLPPGSINVWQKARRKGETQEGLICLHFLCIFHFFWDIKLVVSRVICLAGISFLDFLTNSFRISVCFCSKVEGTSLARLSS